MEGDLARSSHGEEFVRRDCNECGRSKVVTKFNSFLEHDGDREREEGCLKQPGQSPMPK